MSAQDVLRAAFLSALAVQRIDDSDLWKLLQPLGYRSAVAAMQFEVPIGFITNFVTGREAPGVAWLAGTISEEAAALHDYLYAKKLVSRSMADRIFVEALEVMRVRVRAAEAAKMVDASKFDKAKAAIGRGVSNVIDVTKHWLMFAGLRVGGGSHYGDGNDKVILPPEDGTQANIWN